MAEGSDRNTDNDLVDRFALGCVTGHANSLVDMKRSSRNDFATFNGNSSIVDTGCGKEFVVAKLSARALKILTDSKR